MLPSPPMPTPPPPRKVFLPKKGSQKRQSHLTNPADLRMRSYIVDEIHAYTAIRDIAVSEAEKEPTFLTLERACIANEYLENRLKPMRDPYEAQQLSEQDAARELENCQEIRIRLSLLRAHVEAMGREVATPEPVQVA